MEFKDDERIVDSVRNKIGFFKDKNPMLETMGVEVTSFTFGEVRLDAEVTHNLTNIYGIAHGGLAMVLADTAMGGACLGCNKRVVTLSMNMNYLKALPEGTHVYAVGKVVHNGQHTMVCEADVIDEFGDVCLKAQGTFYVLKEYTY
ncbi:MAG: PaaI family thioesterase [Schwartzia sp.]|nr:PaaI family thioesterase [Schwartzia sp. (in: firmicutes)]